MNEQALLCRAFFLMQADKGVGLKKLIAQFMKFGIVGVIAFVIDMSRRREFIIFIVLSVCGLGINDLLMWLMVDSLYIDYRLSKIVVTVVVAVWNFVTRKIFLEAHD